MAQMDLRLSRLGKKDCIRLIAVLNISFCEQQSFAGGCKPDIRPAFFGQLQVDPGRCNIDQLISSVTRKVAHQLIGEIRQHFLVIAAYPAGSLHIYILKDGIHVIFALQTIGDYIKL